MKKCAFTLVFVFLIVRLQAQECLGLPIKSGMGYEMLTYNGKDKMTGKMVYIIKEVKKEAGATLLQIEMQTFDAKDKPQSSNSFKCTCKGNEMMMDMSSLMAGQENPMLKDAKMTFTSNDLVYSNSYKVGETLKDASINGDGVIGGGMNISYSMAMKNRKVLSQENITIPAGTYNAYKVASDMTVNTKTIMNISFDFQTVSFRVPNILWDLRSETYRKDKLMSYSVLSKLF